MSSLQASIPLFSSNCYSSSSSSSPPRRRFNVNAALSVPKLPKIDFSKPIRPITDLRLEKLIPEEKIVETRKADEVESSSSSTSTTSTEIKLRAQMYAILEAVCDRVEMHNNIKEQRDNWNKLLLNSINMMTLTAVTMATIAGACGGYGGSVLGLKLSSTLLFSGSTAMMVLMNKIQPSQLAEEQRNADRLFKQLKREIETKIATNASIDEEDIDEAMEMVLALDRAYPLPLLGDKMIEKFPKSFKPSVWWPSKNSEVGSEIRKQSEEMRDVVEVMRSKDGEDYERLGNLVLKTNKLLAVTGPLMSGVAAGCSVFVGCNAGAAVAAAVAGAVATVVNSLEHGGQVGMVVEMYRNCGGLFRQLEEESMMEKKRENVEVFEMKMALKLGRSLSELRDLARKARDSRIQGTQIQEFASKLL